MSDFSQFGKTDKKILKINKSNFIKFRQIVREQNVLFEELFEEDEYVQEYFESAMRVNAKLNGIEGITMESRINTIHCVLGTPYDLLLESTIYQIAKDFARLQKIENYHMLTMARANGAYDGKIENFATEIVFKDPKDDVVMATDDIFDSVGEIFG